MRSDDSFRCMAEGRDGGWWAICIDLDIAVQGSSFAEVRESLNQAIDMYLARVSELPPEEQRRLLRRPAPWHIRARFHGLSLLSRFRDSGRHRKFEIAAHA